MSVFHLSFTYMICFAAQDTVSASNINDISKDILSRGLIYDLNVYPDNLDVLLPSESRSNTIDLEKWFSNMDVLIKASSKALKRIQNNVKTNYPLDPNFKRLLEEIFFNSDEYHKKIRSELDKMMDDKNLTTSEESMFTMIDTTIILIEKLVSDNLNQMKFILPTEWYSNLKNRIQRQEVKAAAGFITKHMCDINICRKPKVYTDYVKVWLRYLLNLKSKHFKEFSTVIPDILEKYKHFIKSNVKFRKSIKYIMKSDITIQKDCLALLDEILITPKIFRLIPNHVKKAASLLKLAFIAIDDNYKINQENEKELNSITEKIRQMLDGKSVYVHGVLNKILDNLEININIWPLDEQSDLDNLWAEIIH